MTCGSVNDGELFRASRRLGIERYLGGEPLYSRIFRLTSTIYPSSSEGGRRAALGTVALHLKARSAAGVRVDPRKENGRAPTRSLDPRVITSLQVGDWLEMLTTLVYAASAPKQLLYLTLLPAALHPMAIGVIAGIVLARGQSGPGAALCMERLQ